MISLTPLHELFEKDESSVSPQLLRDQVLQDFKQTQLAGIAEADIEVTFQDQEDNAILVRVVDPEKARGYQIYSGEEDYFNQLQAELIAGPHLRMGR